MKKIIVYLAVIICLAASALAADLIFNNWVYGGQSFTVKDHVVTVLLGKYDDRIVLDINSQLYNIDRGHCKRIQYINYCYNSSQYDANNELKVLIKIYSYEPELAITRTISSNTLLVGTSAEITVTLANNGDFHANDVHYEDNLPTGTEITECYGCQIADSTVYWEGELAAGTDELIRYKIIPRQPFNTNLKAYIVYNDWLGEHTVYSSLLNIKASEILNTTVTFSSAQLKLGEKCNMTYNVTNLADHESKIDSLVFMFPKGIDVYSYPSSLTQLTESSYEWSGTVWSNSSFHSSQIFKFVLIGKNTGRSTIQTHVDYTNLRQTYHDDNYNLLSVTPYGVLLTSNWDSNQLMESGESKQLLIFAQNQNPDIKYESLNFSLNSDLKYFDSSYLSMLNPSSLIRIVDQIIIAPEVNKTTNYYITVNASYLTGFKEPFAKNFQQKIKVQPRKTLVITQALSKTSPDQGEDIQVTIKVKNNRGIDVHNVTIADSWDSPVQISGITKKKITIPAGDTMTIYSYKVYGIDQPSKINLTTQLSYIGSNLENISYESIKQVRVKPKSFKLALSRTLSLRTFYLNDLLGITATIKNNDDENIYDVYQQLPLGSWYDLVDSETEKIRQIKPGEAFTFNPITIRLKENNSKTVPVSIISFLDANNIRYQKNSTINKIKILNGYLDGPAIFVNKSAVQSVKVGESTLIKLLVINRGNEVAIVNITDHDKHWQISLGPAESELISHAKQFNQVGIITLPPAVIHYGCKLRTCSTISNMVNLTVIEEIKPIVQADSSQPIVLNTSIINISPINNSTLEAQTTVFQKLIGWIMNLIKR